MSSYSSRNNRYYDSVRQSHSGNSRSQSGNPGDDENIEGMSEDLQKIFDDDSKCSRLLKKILREDRSFDLRIQRIQEFQAYLEKSDSNKVIHLFVLLFTFECYHHLLVYYEISSTSP
jgi:hypothetical protein